MKRIFTILFITVVSVLSTISCSYEVFLEPEPIVPTDSVSFAKTIVPIFSDRGCTGCHPSSAGLDLSESNAYTSIFDNNLVKLNDPSESSIYTIPSSSGTHFKTYTAQQELYILLWIQEGANNN